MVIVHDPECTAYWQPGHPERPGRVRQTERHLRSVMPELEWTKPAPASDQDLLRAHTPSHLARLRVARDFDSDTPFFEDIDSLARLSAGAAIEAARLALEGRPAFSLMRPPGHHATTGKAMGFCYLNSIAVAALHAAAAGVERVAVWDFDAHHGNGTEEILLERPGFLYVSVHQHPGYPGSGAATAANCVNLPVAPNTPAEEHMRSLDASWEAILDFRPGLLLVSAGFDAYEADPLTAMTLRIEDFAVLGSWIQGAGLRTAAILEGGYSDELPQLAAAFLRGWTA